MNDSTPLFWTEGTIDAIELDGNDAAIRFRLVPSTPFLVETESGKRVLFRKEKPDGKAKIQNEKEPPPDIQNMDLLLNAKLVRCVKDREDGKEGLWCRWFAWLPTQPRRIGRGIRRLELVTLPTFGPGLLLEAKRERTTVRVGISDTAFGGDSGKVPLPPPYTISSLIFA